MRRTVLLCALLGSACGQHLALKVPEANAPASERMEAYQRLQFPPNNEQIFNLSFAETEGFNLANGMTVRYTKDLLAVVPKDSATAYWVKREHRATIGSIAMLSGGLFFAGWGVTGANLPGDFAEGLRLPTLFLSTSIILLYASSQAQGYARISKSLALQSYNFSLRKQLGLCQVGTTLLDCSSTTP